MTESYCDGCGQTDNHPKHSIYVGSAMVYGQQVFHPQDTNKDGLLEFHFDCDDKNPYSEIGDTDAAEKAKSGVKGDKLRAYIVKRDAAKNEEN